MQVLEPEKKWRAGQMHACIRYPIATNTENKKQQMKYANKY